LLAASPSLRTLAGLNRLRNYRCRVCNSADWPVKCDIEVSGECKYRPIERILA